MHGYRTDTLENSGAFSSRIAKVSSTTVELTAVLWAFLWLLASHADCCFPLLVLHTDSQVALGLAELRFCSEVHKELQMIVCTAFAFVKDRMGCTLQHIQAHRGDPWNEL